MQNKILLFSHLDPTARNDLGNGYVREFIRNGALFLDHDEIYFKYGNKGTEKYIEEFIDKNRITALVHLEQPYAFHLRVEFLEKLRRKVFVAIMFADSDSHFEVRDRYYAQATDLVIAFNSSVIGEFKRMGVNSVLFPCSYDTKRYFRKKNARKDVEVAFVGLIVGKMDRLSYINHLLANGIGVEVFGQGSPNGMLSPEKMIDLFNRTKINLNFSAVAPSMMGRNARIQLRYRQTKGRLAETALCGGFVLSEYAAGIEELFEVGRELDVFYDKGELLAKARYYLEHEREREAIAENGYRRAVRDYDVELTMPKLIEEMERFIDRKTYRCTELYIDEVFTTNYMTYRVLLAIRFIKLLKFSLAFEELKMVLRNRRLDFYQVYRFVVEEVLDEFPRLKSWLKTVFGRKPKGVIAAPPPKKLRDGGKT